ncbi:hypothetical protein AB0M20_03300 [Actinoplanes sp. NPDC051633]|uniref:hypothetical protein n=1 Tax=Actinoplanes sp. NPDC051633 TaxID=3155670 RepID=UPI0034476930
MVAIHLAAAADESSGLASNRLLLAAVGAVLGFISGYFLEIVKTRRGPRTALSWELLIDEPKLSYGATKSDRLKISYLGREVDRLVSVRFTISNTGNTAIKNQFIRFKIPGDARILHREIDPTPEPEMGVLDISDEDPKFEGPRYKINQLDPGEAVSFFLASEGGSWQQWNGVVLRNEEMDVSYQRRDVAQRRDDQKHVAPFLFGLAAIVIVTTLAGAAALIIWILSKFYFTEIAYLVIILVVTLLLSASAAYLLSHAVRATRSIAQWVTGISGRLPTLEASGGSWFAYAPNGVVRVEMQDKVSESE